jgi:uncharacterized membrane protein YphA (DoxX/SURF4 family)
MSLTILAVGLARMLLVVVFGAAGLGKLLDPGGARQSVRAFGVADRRASAFAVLLASAELAVAVGLLVNATAWWAAATAIVLLALFSVAIVRVMRRGEAPECRCFGRLHSAPIGRATLVRNGFLGGIALVVLARGPGAPGQLSWTAVAIGAAIGAALLVGWLVVELLRRNGRLLARIDELEQAFSAAGLEIPGSALPVARVGAPAPPFALSDLDGRPVHSSDLLPVGQRMILLFASPSCRPCRVALRRLAARNAAGRGSQPAVAVIGEGAADAWRALPAELRPAEVLLQEDREVADLFGADVTPAAVVIAADGTLAGPPALGAAAVCALLEPGEDRLTETPSGGWATAARPRHAEALTVIHSGTGLTAAGSLRVEPAAGVAL